MRRYSNIISLTKNSRGVFSLDPLIGCTSGTRLDKRGCYGDCYASRIATIYGYDFTKTVKRDFKNLEHLKLTIHQINKVKLPFIRMGTMGDPSEDWEHTLCVISKIQESHQLKIWDVRKEVVIITKHWGNISDKQLSVLKSLKVCINTSVSALDEDMLLRNSLEQYNRLKPYCRSILRVVSCDFNKDNNEGLRLSKIQDELFKLPVLDTVFRPSKKSKLVADGIILAKEGKFLGKRAFLSKFNKKTYIGNCNNCLEMCGVYMD